MANHENKVADIFFSYAYEDKAKAELLAHALEQQDWTVGRVHSLVQTGELIVEAIEQAISKANCVILVWSNAASKSGWIILNAAKIADQQKKLIPIRLDDSKLPAELEVFQTLDFANWNGEQTSAIFIRLINAIEHLIGLSRNDRNKAKSTRIEQTEAQVKSPLAQKKILQLPDIDWVEIPASSFIYGKDTAGGYGNGGYDHGPYDGSFANSHSSEWDNFFISRYPFTHCQYQTFVDAGGYRDERWWQGLRKSQPVEANWTQPNRPRENVNWYEAMAFCRWLSAQFGYVINLPTEQQWEIAARGTDSKEYPWGTNFRTGDANVYLDSNQENLNQTCAVGLFPHRGSPYQVMDMAGNVWEWCLNEFDRPAQIEPNNSNAPRVMRGGCWDQKALDARTFVRRSRHPDLRDYDVGFRVVCQSPK